VLAGVLDNVILAFASHSRNTSCEGKKDRRQFGKWSLSKAETVVVVIDGDTGKVKKGSLLVCKKPAGYKTISFPWLVKS